MQPLPPQPRKQENPEQKRSSIWIRPHDVRNILVELRALAHYYLSPPRLPKWKGILRLGADLLGIAIVLSFIYFSLTQALINTSLRNAQSAPLISGCAAKQGCDKVPATPKAMPSQLPLHVSPVTTLTPVLAPTSTLVPRPTSNLTPTPSAAILSVRPSSLTVSYSHVCAIKAPVLLGLKNDGATTLLWSQDMNNTSPGISIVDPTKAYVLHPDQGVNVNAFCSPSNNKGQYELLILYNAGEVTVPITVTD